MFKALIEGTDFKGAKFVYSLLVAVVVAILSLITGLTPDVIWTSHGDQISMLLSDILSTGVFIPLIYMIEKVFAILKAAYDRYKKMFEKP